MPETAPVGEASAAFSEVLPAILKVVTDLQANQPVGPSVRKDTLKQRNYSYITPLFHILLPPIERGCYIQESAGALPDAQVLAGAKWRESESVECFHICSLFST